MAKIPKPSLLIIGESHLERVYKDYLEVDEVEKIDTVIERIAEPGSFYLKRFKRSGALEGIEKEYVSKPVRLLREFGAEVLFIERPDDRDMRLACKMYKDGASHHQIAKELFARKKKSDLIKVIKEGTCTLNERLKKEGVPERFWLPDISTMDGVKEYKLSRNLFKGYEFKIARMADVKEVVPLESPDLFHRCDVLEATQRLLHFLSLLYKHPHLGLTKGTHSESSVKQEMTLLKSLNRVQDWIRNEFDRMTVERDKIVVRRIREEIRERKAVRYAIIYGQAHVKALEAGLGGVCEMRYGGMVGGNEFLDSLDRENPKSAGHLQ